MKKFNEFASLNEANWIAGAIKRPGALHAKLGVPQGEKIPAKKLNAAAKKGGLIGKEANLAKTLKKFHKEEVEQLGEEVHGYHVYHRGKHIDTVFYSQHEDPADVKKSLVNHDSYHPDIKVVKEPRRPRQSVKESLNESFMSTYNRNENANRHTANIVHLAKHYGDKDDQAKAEFYAKELKKHGHNIHHKAQYEIHKKLWPHAVAHAKLMKEDVEQLNELKKSTLKSYIRKSYGDIGHQSGMVAHLKAKKYKHPWLKQSSADQLKVHTRKEKNRGEGIDRAVTKLGEEVQLDETMTRKHFQQVADVIKSHPDAEKRTELAKHHAAIFKASNPRFDHKRFYAAANAQVNEGVDKWRTLDDPMHTKSVIKPKLKKFDYKKFSKDRQKHPEKFIAGIKEETTTPKYQVGQTVTPKIGPHSGIKHTVIHVHPDGAYNIKPNVHASLNKYRLGAARAQEKDLE